MPNGTYGGVRGKETKAGQKTFVSRPTRLHYTVLFGYRLPVRDVPALGMPLMMTALLGLPATAFFGAKLATRGYPQGQAVRSWKSRKRTCLNTAPTEQTRLIRCISEQRNSLTGRFILLPQVGFCKTSHSLPFFLVNTSCKAVSLIVNSSMPFIWARLSLNRHARALYLLFTSFSFIVHSLWQISFFVAM